ncbi:MAG: hypothetical protein D6721_04490, partial [Gammaproteobacteria bacterium]
MIEVRLGMIELQAYALESAARDPGGDSPFPAPAVELDLEGRAMGKMQFRCLHIHALGGQVFCMAEREASSSISEIDVEFRGDPVVVWMGLFHRCVPFVLRIFCFGTPMLVEKDDSRMKFRSVRDVLLQ